MLLGSAPIDLVLSQISAVGMIYVSWTPPPAPPSNGYQITVDSDNDMDTKSSSQEITVALGVHTIRVQSRSIHFPGGIAAMDITVLGKRDRAIYYVMYMYMYTETGNALGNPPLENVRVSSLTATLVTLSWTQATNSLPAERYTVSLTRMTGDDSGMCALPSDTRSMINIPPSTTSMEFTNLAEFSDYTFTVSAVDTSNPSSTTFITPSIGKYVIISNLLCEAM